MKHSVPHSLGHDRACSVTKKALGSYCEKFSDYSPKIDWANDSEARIGLSIMGMTITGKVQVTDSSIDLDLSVPFMLRPFQGKAVQVIENEINKWIEEEESE